MNDQHGMTSDRTPGSLPALLLLFVGSGCAALIYEVVWFQLLQLVIGSSAISLGVLLGTFMGGMCLGSFLLPRYIDARHHPLKVYAYLELGIGAMGLILLFGMPLVSFIYTYIAGGHVAVRAIFAALCLLPPTLMMGATLPAIARYVETTPRGVAWMGFFYGGNIFGAVIGSLLAGFYLLRVFDMAIATYVAVALNVAVAGLGLLFSKSTSYTPATVTAAAGERAPGATSVYLAIALSGFTALSAQVLWTRLLSLLFGATVYTFSLILGVFLAGLGIGSSIGSAIARSGNARVALGWCQMLLCGALAWAGYMMTQSLPYWPINPALSTDPWFNFQLDMVRCAWVVLPGSILWGASFPLALAAVAGRGQDPARLVGGVYAANTVGAIFGSVVTGLMLVIWIGTRHAEMVLIVASAVSGLMLLAPVAAGESSKGRLQWVSTIALVLATGAAGLLARSVPDIPGLLVAYGRYAATWVGMSNIIYVGEGLNAFVAVSQLSSGVRNYHNAGKVQASSEPQDMRLQRMLGHITHLIPQSPKRALVIGFGAGATAGAVSIGPDVEKMTIAEIEPLGPALGLGVLRRAQLQRRQEPEGHDSHRRRAALPAHDERQVRRDHVRPPRSLGQGGGHALHHRVLRSGEEAPESRRRRHLVRPALRKQHGGSQERDRHLFHVVPACRHLGQHEQRAGLRSRPDGTGRSDQDRPRRDGRQAPDPEVRAGRAIAAGNRLQLGRRAVLDLCGAENRPRALARRRDDQSRSQSAAAVPRRDGPEPLSERADLFRDARAHEVS